MRIKFFIILFIFLFLPLSSWAKWLALSADDTSDNTAVNTTSSAKKTSDNDIVVDFINIVKKEDSVIAVSWHNPNGLKQFRLNIYRDSSVLDNTNKLTSSNRVKTIKFSADNEDAVSASSFEDKIKNSGTYYYAVTVAVGNKEYKKLLADQNYTTYGIKIEIKKKLPLVNHLEGSVDEKGKAHLSWQCAGSNVSYNIYSSKVRITNAAQLTKKQAVRKELSAVIALPEEGNYYFAVTVSRDSSENKTIITGENSLSAPLVYKIEKKETTAVKTNIPSVKTNEPAAVKAVTITAETEQTYVNNDKEIKTETDNDSVPVKDYDYIIRTIRRKYVNTKKYSTAVSRINELLSDDQCPDNFRSEAKLMLGKIYYYQHKYKEAVKIFSHLQSVYPSETEFWIRRASDKF